MVVFKAGICGNGAGGKGADILPGLPRRHLCTGGAGKGEAGGEGDKSFHGNVESRFKGLMELKVGLDSTGGIIKNWARKFTCPPF